MLSVDEEQEVDVRGSLARRSRSLRATGRRSWDAKSLIDGVGDIHVRWTNEWLLLTAQLGDPLAQLASHAEGTWNCLRANREFSGGVKIVLQPETGRLGTAAEIPMPEEDPAWESHLDATFRGMTQAFRWRPGAEMLDRVPEQNPETDLATLCQVAGWTCSERADGAVAVSLETSESVSGGGGCLAAVGNDSARGVTARLEMHSCKEAELTEQIELALGRLLLKAGGLVRFALPVAWNSDSRIKLGFEVALGSAATPARLTAALGALSVAWQLCGREVQALAHPVTAEAFLAASKQPLGRS